MIEVNLTGLNQHNRDEDDTLSRREMIGVVLGLMGNMLLLIGHYKKTIKPTNPEPQKQDLKNDQTIK